MIGWSMLWLYAQEIGLNLQGNWFPTIWGCVTLISSPRSGLLLPLLSFSDSCRTPPFWLLILLVSCALLVLVTSGHSHALLSSLFPLFSPTSCQRPKLCFMDFCFTVTFLFHLFQPRVWLFLTTYYFGMPFLFLLEFQVCFEVASMTSLLFFK